MLSYEFKKGELNKFNNLNQDIKNIFSSYILYDNGFILGDAKLSKGKHFAFTDYKMIEDETHVFKYDSTEVFTAIKNNKKNIKTLEVNDDVVYFKGTNNIVITIGNYLHEDDVNVDKELIEFCNDINSKHDSDVTITLSEDHVTSLVNNEYMNVEGGGYKTRITKEVIPGLKKSYGVTLAMFEHNSDDTLFYLCIRVDRATCISYHVYTCLHM